MRSKKIINLKRGLITLEDPKSSVSESYRTLRTNIQFSNIDQQLRMIMVTSSGPGEGKSTTIANLAVVTAEMNKKTLLVDTDLRKPTVHHTFEVANRHGLTTYLAGQSTLDSIIQATRCPNLDVITSGPIPPNPVELLNSKAMEQFIQDIAQRYDQVLFDSPPVIAVTDAQVLATKLDGVILVVDSGATNQDMALKAKQLLENVQAKLLGVVLNNKKVSGDSYYYYYYGGKK